MDDRKPIKLFYSYSHEDEALRNKLEKHLTILKREGYIEMWHDRKITAGSELEKEIHENLDNAEIILLLISADFIASDYCYDIEMKTALQMHEEGKAVVIPVILRDCLWQSVAPFKKLLAIPTDGKAIAGGDGSNMDTAFTDAAKQLKVKIEELWHKKEATATTTTTQRPSTSTTKPSNKLGKDIPFVKPYFAGREEEGKKLKAAFETSPFILIEGGGGIGKSQFVAKFIADEHLAARTLWFKCTPNTHLDEVIRDTGFEELLKGEGKTDRTKYSAFKDKIEENDLVILLDDYHEVEGNENFRAFLSFIDEYLTKGHLVIMGRDNVAGITPINPKPIHIGGLASADSLKHARSLINYMYGQVVVADDVLQSICDKLLGYPLAIDLAVHLLSKGIAPGKIIEVAIQEAKGGNLKVDVMVRRLLNEVFTRTDTTPDEITFLELFSVFRGKVETAAARAVIPDAIFGKASSGLINRNILNMEGGQYELHPLIREYCYELLEHKEDVHVKAATYYKTLRDEKLNPELEEKIYGHLAAAMQWDEICQIIVERGRDFIVLGNLDQLQQMISSVKTKNRSADIFNVLEGDIAEIKGDWENAKILFEQAAKSSDEKIKIEATIKGGEMLYRVGDAKAAKSIYEQVIEDTKDKEEFIKLYTDALCDLGRVYEFFEKYDDALRLLNIALKIREQSKDQSDIAVTLINISIVKEGTGHYKEALALAEKSLNIFKEVGNKQGIGSALHQIALIKENLLLYDEAMKWYGQSLAIGKEIGHKGDIAATLNNLGGVSGKKGKMDKQLEYYDMSYSIAKEIGDKYGIAVSLSNIAGNYIALNKEKEKACNYLIESIALRKEIGKRKVSSPLSWLQELKRKTGDAYKEMVNDAINQLAENLKQYIDKQEVLFEPRVADPKTGRNDPCWCGSGKKYKACHGKGGGAT